MAPVLFFLGFLFHILAIKKAIFWIDFSVSLMGKKHQKNSFFMSIPSRKSLLWHVLTIKKLELSWCLPIWWTMTIKVDIFWRVLHIKKCQICSSVYIWNSNFRFNCFFFLIYGTEKSNFWLCKIDNISTMLLL